MSHPLGTTQGLVRSVSVVAILANLPSFFGLVFNLFVSPLSGFTGAPQHTSFSYHVEFIMAGADIAFVVLALHIARNNLGKSRRPVYECSTHRGLAYGPRLVSDFGSHSYGAHVFAGFFLHGKFVV